MAVTPRDALQDLMARPFWVPKMPGYLFTFGRGSAGRLGKLSQDTASPVSPLGSTKVFMIGAGEYHMVVATTEKKLFLWGDLTMGDFEDGPRDITSMLPSEFKWPPRQISCAHHSFGLVDANKNAFRTSEPPFSIQQMSLSNVKQLEMRAFHTVVLTENGTVWQTTEDLFPFIPIQQVTTDVKSLGIGAWDMVTLIMRYGTAQMLSEDGGLLKHRLRDGERVLHAADGNTSSLWLTSHGVVKVNQGNLEEERYPPFNTKTATETTTPPACEQLHSHHDLALCKVCAGSDYTEPTQHYAALTRDGDVLTWGQCPSFECGVPNRGTVKAPGAVPWVPRGSCLDVVTGENFTAVLLTVNHTGLS
ncbi:hypothetical protein Pelo_5385 [Pelomyxa schiedti]|nr:hypothetical protein Pelo_5385 [Pelomyxa schiedti]